MSFKELVAKARTYRRFQEEKTVSMDFLTDIIDTVRLVSSGQNRQPLRYAVSNQRAMNARIFEQLAWAGQYKDWKGPAEGERPAAYIVIGGDTDAPRFHQVDHGIAAQTIQLALADAGLGCCMIHSVNAKAVHELVGFPEHITVLMVIAIGYPGETVILEEIGADGATAYWRDAAMGHHVPKRLLNQVLAARFEE